jgi:hypothetical protein
VWDLAVAASVLLSCRTISLLLAVGPDACGTGVSVGLCGLAVCLFSLSFGRWPVGAWLPCLLRAAAC